MRGYPYKVIQVARNEHDHNCVIGRFKRQYYAERFMNLLVENEKTWTNYAPNHYQITYRNKFIAYR